MKLDDVHKVRKIEMNEKDSKNNKKYTYTTIFEADLTKHQNVYRIDDGDFVGDISGNNITVVVLNGNINGNVTSNNGEIFLAKGDINGDVKADKILCPNDPTKKEKSEDGTATIDLTTTSIDDGYITHCDGCSRTGSMMSNKECDCTTCWHYVKGVTHNYCTFNKLVVLGDDKPRSHYDGKGHTTKYHVNCKRFSNSTGDCFIFHTLQGKCPMSNMKKCPHYIKRS